MTGAHSTGEQFRASLALLLFALFVALWVKAPVYVYLYFCHLMSEGCGFVLLAKASFVAWMKPKSHLYHNIMALGLGV